MAKGYISPKRVARIIEGRELPGTEHACGTCGSRLREGQPITAAVEQTAASWTVTRLWCVTDAPTENAAVDEPLLVEGDLATVADTRNQRHYSVLIQTAAVGDGRVIEA